MGANDLGSLPRLLTSLGLLPLALKVRSASYGLTTKFYKERKTEGSRDSQALTLPLKLVFIFRNCSELLPGKGSCYTLSTVPMNLCPLWDAHKKPV